MPFVPANNAARVEIRCLYLLQNVENTLWFACSQTITESLLEELAGAISTWFQTEILPNLSISVILQEVYAVDMTTQTGSTFADTSGAGEVGTATSPAMPGNVTVTVSFRTSSRGRSGRGRNYIFGLVEENVTGNSVSTTWLNTIRDGYGELLVAALPEEWTWVVASLYSNGAPRTQALLSPVQAAVVVDYDVDSQRRRLAGRGS